MVAVRDVARRAGVSTTTVSHVMNGTRFVSKELCERVQTAVEELDYQPNAAARSLTLKRTNTIGLIVSDIRDPFFASVARGVDDLAHERGYSVLLCNSDEDATRESTYLKALQTRQVDGLLVAAAGAAQAYLARLVRSGLPVVLVDRELPDLDAPAILLDNAAGAYAAVRHLTARGHRRIAMITGHPSISTTIDWIAGYRRALIEAGIEVDDRLIVTAASTCDGGVNATLAVLGVAPPVTALLSGNHLTSIGALQALASRSLRVPDDVAVVSFDYLPYPWADAFRPHLTTVLQPTYELGRKAAETLVNLCGQAAAQPPPRIVLESTLVVRESSGLFTDSTRLAAQSAPAGAVEGA
jgi:LacI family transcriptional regulator